MREDELNDAGLQSAALPRLRFAALIFDLSQYSVHIRRRIIAKEAPGEWRVRGQFTGFVKIPDFTRVLRLEQLGRRAAESRAHIIDVTLQQGESAVVAGGVHRLGKVDDDRPVDIQQNVEVGKVAVDQPRA